MKGVFAMKSFWLCSTFFIASLVTAQNFDINLLKSINNNRNKSLDPTFQFISNSVSPLTVGVPIGFVIHAFIRKDSLSKRQAFQMVGTQLISLVLTTSLKYGVNRERPGVTYSFIEVKSPAGDPSFPSGHTSASFALATSISMVCPKWYVIVPAYAWATSVAYSRMDLGCHYPTDVLAGAIIGSGSAYLNRKLNKILFKK